MMHFCLVIVFANPVGHEKNKMSYIAGAYVYPYFQQNWNLFTPAPVSNYTLYAKPDNENVSQDIFNEILIKHQSNRLAGDEPFLIAFTNTIHYFEKNTSLIASLNGPLKGDRYFDILEHSTKNYLQISRKKHFSSVKLILIVKDVITKEQRVYFN